MRTAIVTVSVLEMGYEEREEVHPLKDLCMGQRGGSAGLRTAVVSEGLRWGLAGLMSIWALLSSIHGVLHVIESH